MQAPDGVDATALTPGFPTFINGNSLVNSNMGWFALGPVPQGFAGYEGDGDASMRVLIMQLAVNAGESVRGTVSVSGATYAGLEGVTTFIANGQSFSVPAPGALALLVWGSLAPSRRDRA
jgi:hypothetical protein